MGITTKRKRYKYVVYTRIVCDEEWAFITKEKEFKTKTEAIEYLIQRSEDEIKNYKLDLDDIVIDGLAFQNFKTNSITWIQKQSVV